MSISQNRVTRIIHKTEHEPAYRIAPDVCFSTDSDGTIILDIQGGKFHSLIQSGSRAWSMIAARPDGTTRTELVDRFMKADEFATEPRDKVESSLDHILQQLTRDRLLDTDQSKQRSTLQSLNCNLCVGLATAIRYAGNTLIRFRNAPAAAFIEFAFYEAIRKFGGFYARHRIIQRWPVATRSQTDNAELPALCEAVHTAAVWYPKQTLCLQKASVTTSLLRQHGFQADMKIGIRKQPFHAHAWVEVDGKVVGDDQNVQKYFREIASW
ncbi:MAG TPA: lasso peptide biosynthesis B2 protein [Pyrinomonadaceae bacterium]|nr:lasso peptide biosynthesis B2 protein [Pyrinomonadaceae bacterium]